MSMNDSALASAIYSAIVSTMGTPANPTELQKFCNALGQAIVEYIKANAVCTIPGAGSGTIS